ncbi:dioxygenase family protein [Azohydromonas caseinilytica]|uniref:Intradiol ring-cleavage dioxygenase n=1 Tax=Azohydromonas caseinilytica TaxID=2728836 RepID=A0A848FDW5_9BURK|nr:protocatechuate 3,4-dioxygenase [Azohydromonas caseinilytica]NML17216.1 intradiol ring-cleavage dioxygenase [Azohydromonas caseinilytica]
MTSRIALPLRRQLLARLAAGLAVTALPPAGRAAARLRPTPAQTEGPFYPVRFGEDTDADLLAHGARRYMGAQPCWVSGTVTDTAGMPLAGAVVEIWQCDGQGHYHHPGDGDRADPAFQGFGRVLTGADGGYHFHTIRPVAYAGRAPHIHFKVRALGRELLTTQLYVEGDPGNARDGLWRRLSAAEREAVTRPFVAGPDGLACEFPLVVEA